MNVTVSGSTMSLLLHDLLVGDWLLFVGMVLSDSMIVLDTRKKERDKRLISQSDKILIMDVFLSSSQASLPSNKD